MSLASLSQRWIHVSLRARWLLLAVTLVWLVGCAHPLMGKKKAARDPFAAEKFSCGEEIPKGRAQ